MQTSKWKITHNMRHTSHIDIHTYTHTYIYKNINWTYTHIGIKGVPLLHSLCLF